MIYELITAFQLTPKLFYLLTHQSITVKFSTFGCVVSAHFYFCSSMLSSGAISGAGLWHNRLQRSDSPKTLTNKTTLLYLDSEITSHFSSIAYPSHPFICSQFSLSHTSTHTQNKRSSTLSGTSSQGAVPDWLVAVVLPALFPAGQGYWQSHLALPHQWPKPGPPAFLHWLPIKK